MSKNQNFTASNLRSCLRTAIAAKLLMNALQRDLFTFLEKRRGIDEIAAHFGWHRQNCIKYLELLSYLGLVEFSKNEACNMPASSHLLREGSPQNIRALLLEMHKWCMAPLDHLDALLCDGPFQQEAKSQDTESSLSETMWETIVRSGARPIFEGDGQRLAREIVSLPGADGFRRMLDLGGGHGAHAIMTTKALPELRADILDFPAVLKIAHEFVQQHGLCGQIELVPADYTRDELPSGYDLILASDTLNVTLHQEGTGKVIKKIHASLNAGGYFVSLHDAPPPPSEVGHPRVNWPFECHVYELASGLPMGMPASDFIAHEMARAGFTQISSRYIELDSGIRRLDVAYKS